MQVDLSRYSYDENIFFRFFNDNLKNSVWRHIFYLSISENIWYNQSDNKVFLNDCIADSLCKYLYTYLLIKEDPIDYVLYSSHYFNQMTKKINFTKILSESSNFSKFALYSKTDMSEQQQLRSIITIQTRNNSIDDILKDE